MENSLSNYFDKVSVAKKTKQHIRIIKKIGDSKKSQILTIVSSWPQRLLGFEGWSKKYQQQN